MWDTWVRAPDQLVATAQDSLKVSVEGLGFGVPYFNTFFLKEPL